MKTVLAIDGNSLTHRAYHAFLNREIQKDASAASNPVWALEGLIEFIGVLVEKVKPQLLIVGLDDAEKSVRRDNYPLYKAGRSEKDEALKTQLARIPEVLKMLGIDVYTPGGLEADDVLAGAKAWAKENSYHCIIATSDRDAFALIDETTSVLRLVNGGPDKAELFTPEKLEERYTIKPKAYPLYASIRGDASDNLPGVDGVGEKGAAKIVAQAETLKELQEELTKDSPFKGELSRSVITKLQDPIMLGRLLLNERMMKLIEVNVKESDLCRLPLKEEDFHDLEKAGVKVNARAKTALTAHPDSAAVTSDSKEAIKASENITRSETLQALQKAAQRLQAPQKEAGSTPTKEAEAPGSLKSEATAPYNGKVFLIPNPRPAKSLLNGLG